MIDAVLNIAIQYNQSRTFLKNIAISSSPARHGDAVPGGNFYAARYLAGSNIVNQYTSALALVSAPAVATTTYIYTQVQFRYWAQTARLYEVDSFRRYINPISTALAHQLAEAFITTFASIAYTPSAIGFYRTTAGVNLLYVGITSNRVAIVNQATKAYMTMTGAVCTSGYMYDIYIDQNSKYMMLSCMSDNAY